MRRRERSARLEEAIASLTPDHRRVVELCRIEGLAVKEVAERMGRSPNAVSMLLLRALRELKTRFGRTESLTLPRPGDSRREGGGDATES
jgi:RNA polymerase sigma factor (sigma-70 family)